MHPTSAPVPPPAEAMDDDDDSLVEASNLFEALDELHICSHPIVKHKISRLRDENTPSVDFRKLVRDVSFCLAYESSRAFELDSIDGMRSPLAPYVGLRLHPRIALCPVLRAGIGMTDAFLDLFPDAQTFYLGLFREKVSLQPVEYYQKLPKGPEVDEVFLLDPMLATGGTAIAAINMILDWGIKPSNIHLVVILASMPGLQSVLKHAPGISICCGAVDSELTRKGYIVPGLGDAGDRLFNQW